MQRQDVDWPEQVDDKDAVDAFGYPPICSIALSIISVSLRLYRDEKMLINLRERVAQLVYVQTK